jgi:hypothetical protein
MQGEPEKESLRLWSAFDLSTVFSEQSMDNIDIIFDELKINIVPNKAKQLKTMPENENDVKNLARTLQN